ncbi:MAG: hypothetical protein NZ769_10160, partial [Anaerolineae bacterium]|nr:hypothetical protein [Anaerolineae bacterium]
MGYTFPELPDAWGYLNPDDFVRNHRQIETPTPTPTPPPPPPTSTGSVDVRIRPTPMLGICPSVEFSAYISVTLGRVNYAVVEGIVDGSPVVNEIPIHLEAGAEGRATEVHLLTVPPGGMVS